MWRRKGIPWQSRQDKTESSQPPCPFVVLQASRLLIGAIHVLGGAFVSSHIQIYHGLICRLHGAWVQPPPNGSAYETRRLGGRRIEREAVTAHLVLQLLSENCEYHLSQKCISFHDAIYLELHIMPNNCVTTNVFRNMNKLKSFVHLIHIINFVIF